MKAPAAPPAVGAVSDMGANAMPYTYDTDRAPLWADSARGELVADPVAYAETQPGKLTESDLDRAIAQKRRDTICAASQAPRIPRVIRRQADPHCTGECRQGRDRCAAPQACLLPRMEPAGDDPVLSLVWLLCLSVILCLGAALWFRVEWSDVISWLAMIGGAL